MSRKFILTLAAVGVLAAASLASGAAFAKGPHNGNHNGGHEHHGHYRHFVRIHDRVYIRPVGYAVRTVTPGPCTCLTKNYTSEGMVVFKDLCTKEMASAPVDGSSDQAQAVQGPANFAGQTYQDYLKTNQPAESQKN